uniref:Uncharacterized protein n=1 Tax=Lepeophtheirus salmonis TaxID=72036 RepID=A0A0K2TBC4_LEPSM
MDISSLDNCALCCVL